MVFTLRHPLYPKPEVLALYKENNFPYQIQTIDKVYERWYNKVKKKPAKITSQIDQIFRVRVLNSGSEKIVYDETLRGLDHNDNELEFNHRVGLWLRPVFRKQYDEETDEVISQEIHRHEKIYEIYCEPKTIMELAARGLPDTISLIVDMGTKSWGGSGVFTLEEFANAPIERLVEKARTGERIEVEQTEAASRKPKV
jgi:hypothetical protein